MGTIYNFGDYLQIGRTSKSGKKFVSISDDCLYNRRTDINPCEKKTVIRVTVCIYAP